ncbi:MAG: hypothetical protein HOV80_37830 [Polyangiaceae bacterium]|nr:hypothetical protein [Polyangiaceae bacterium]
MIFSLPADAARTSGRPFAPNRGLAEVSGGHGCGCGIATEFVAGGADGEAAERGAEAVTAVSFDALVEPTAPGLAGSSPQAVTPKTTPRNHIRTLTIDPFRRWKAGGYVALPFRREAL